MHYNSIFASDVCRFGFVFLLMLCGGSAISQMPGYGNVLRLDSAFRLAIANSSRLEVSRGNLDLSIKRLEVVKSERLPSLSSSLDYGYISNADIWNPSFSEHQKGHIPHQFAQLTISAVQLIFQGNSLNTEIEKAGMERQLAQLSLEKNTADIKFLVLSCYLDIYRLINQRQIYLNNTRLAKERLKNITMMKQQGMVTQNDVLRTELSISDYELAARRTESNLSVLYHELSTVLGISDTLMFSPDTSILSVSFKNNVLEDLQESARRSSPDLHLAEQEDRIAEADLKLAKAGRLPALYAYAGTNLQRPFLNTIPSVDIYYNVWRAGLTLRYNLSSIYQSPRKITAAQSRLDLSRKQLLAEKESVEVAVHSGYMRYLDALDQLRTYRNDLGAAEENYRIVEKKYLNQLALQADMIDAANLKTEAELRVTNASINLVYAYYVIQRSIGGLQ